MLYEDMLVIYHEIKKKIAISFIFQNKWKFTTCHIGHVKESHS